MTLTHPVLALTLCWSFFFFNGLYMLPLARFFFELKCLVKKTVHPEFFHEH